MQQIVIQLVEFTSGKKIKQYTTHVTGPRASHLRIKSFISSLNQHNVQKRVR